MSTIRNLGWLIIFSIAVFPSGGYAKDPERPGAGRDPIAVLPSGAKDELTRKGATELLNAELGPVGALRFGKDGFERAKKDGLFGELDTWGRKTFFFKTSVVGRYTLGFEKEYSKSGLVKGLLGLDESGGYGEDRFFINPWIPHQVDMVTGIALSADPNVRVVQFETKYIFPPELGFLRTFVYTGCNFSSKTNPVVFQRFDDGWRIIRFSKGC